jgi:predicted TPR repeat methyltransferase
MSTNDLLSSALAAEGSADLRRAEAIYRQVVAEQPERAEVWHRLAGVLHAGGRTGEAIAAAMRAIDLEPAAAGYHHTLGRLHAARGDVRQAAGCFEKVLALDPADAVACLQLGDALMDLHDYDRALATYRRALAVRSPFPEAHHNLAAALLHLGDPAAAIQECHQAIAQRPGYALALNTLGAALAKVGKIDEAIAALQQALHWRPQYANACHNLGNVLDQAGRVEEAKQAYRATLAINPALEEARYDLAALGAAPPPPSTPRPYLMRLFDAYASSFDQHLVEKLNYQVPEMLYEAVLATTTARAGLDVIDLGCGTGLVGKVFRPIAGRLTGIDVSPAMIDQAKRRQVYDQLVLDDVVNYLQARRDACDLVLGADVFIYIGDLEAVFQAVAQLLRPGGLFVFSLETTTQAEYVLQPNRRYAQSLAYIQRLAGQHDLATALANPVKLRRHGDADAEGLIVVLA